MTDREAMALWVKTWKEAGPLLEEIRLREVRDADNAADLAALASAFNQGLRDAPPEPTSGLV
ncbi:MAG TPA: hypothetical protein VGF59_03990, partial [Bryobacteraceae bacterium]